MLTLRQLSLVLMLLMMGTSPSLLLQVEGTSPSSSTSTDNPSSDPLTTSSTSDRASSDGTTTSRSSSSKLSLRHIFRIGAKDDSPFSSSPSSQIYFERTDFHPDPLHPSNLETSWIPDSDLLHTLPTSVREEAAGVRHPRESVKRLKIIQDIATLLPPPTFFSGAPLLPSSHNKRIKKTQPDYADLKIEHSRQLWTIAIFSRPCRLMSVNRWNGGTRSLANVETTLQILTTKEWGNPRAVVSVLDANGEPVTVAHKSHLLPDDRSKDTVLAMGKMAYNAYYEPTNRWGASDGFGTKGSGIRGYIYASENQDVVVIVIKGTSLQTPFTGGPSSANDKLNDNKMFSCCCGKADGLGHLAATSCDTDCVRSESDFKESYYRLATSIGHTVQQLFPSSSIWMTGHSLGGALASLVALTFDYPAMTFEAPVTSSSQNASVSSHHSHQHPRKPLIDQDNNSHFKMTP
ncbi:Alpha/Beta hydrolase protein [Chytridium lagenaria]|nr:Alpha/Beta hydrolase protein [Chytridium lagenaria]